MSIKKIVIENFKCYRGYFELDLFDNVNIIVGDNESGKSTILEAIHLALSGWYNGRYIYNELNQYLFNYEVIEEYLQSISNGEPTSPPSILIEVYFNTDEIPRLMGNGNSQKVEATGIAFKIEFDERFQDEYEELIKQEDIKSLPIEYYRIYWTSFARDDSITPRLIPLKSSLIDASNFKGYNAHVNKFIRDLLDNEEAVEISQAHRNMKDKFSEDNSVKKINERFQELLNLSTKKFELSVELSSKNAWVDTMVTQLDKIPFNQVGRGEQCIVKTKLALNFGKSSEANVILIEEPENHLSHPNLNRLINEIKAGVEQKQIIINTHSSFVANKIDLKSLILLNDLKTTKLQELSVDTKKFFEKLAGYDTLRLILCKKAILVEGDSDELVVQRAYQDKYGGLPIENNIDVISVGVSFLRFLEIAHKINNPVIVVTDNDGDLEALERKYSEYIDLEKISIHYDFQVDDGDLVVNGSKFNYNTLEPKILKENGISEMNQIFETDYKNVDELHIYMKNNKTDCALKIFESNRKLNYPDYIIRAIDEADSYYE